MTYENAKISGVQSGFRSGPFNLRRNDVSEHLINTPPKPRAEDFAAMLQRQAKSAAQQMRPQMLTKIVPSSIQHHETQASAMESAQTALAQASADGRWMIAVFSVTDGKLQMRTRTTWEFPRGDYSEAVRMLQASIKQEQSLPIDEPLPVAELPPLPSAVGITESPNSIE